MKTYEFDPNNKDHLLERLASLEALMKGFPIQVLNANYCWCPRPCGGEFDAKARYRPAVQPVTRPWSKPSDVPGPVCFIRHIQSEGTSWAMITSASSDSICATNSVGLSHLPYRELACYQYSTTRAESSWLPCTV